MPIRFKVPPKQRTPLRLIIGVGVRIARRAVMHCRLLCLRAKGVTCMGFSYVDRRCRVSRPENIVLGSRCVIGKCHLYALDKLVIGDGTIVGDDCFLCGGTHDIDSEAFELITGPITIGKHVWIANGATILPGVTSATAR